MSELSDIVRLFATDQKMGGVKSVRPYGRGRINDTYLITMDNSEKYVLQKVNPIFAPTVLHDILALTTVMKSSGWTTTELVPTKLGRLGYITNDECWRMLTYVRGRTIEKGVTESGARDAMRLIGKFHQAFSDHPHEFQHVPRGFHDTNAMITLLETTSNERRGTQKYAEIGGLADAILGAYSESSHAWEHLPQRIIHGDPKLSNVRFAENTERAITLLDLDTLGRGSVVIDIGDAARSWANPADEGDLGHTRFDLAIFSAMMEGYFKSAGFISREECDAIPGAIMQITLELSARFVTDAFLESYFKLDRGRYPDLFVQNSTKARAQFALYQDIKKKVVDIKKIISRNSFMQV